MSAIGWEALLDVWQWSGVHPGCPRLVDHPSLMFGSGRETLLDVRDWSGDPPNVRKWSRGPPG